LSRPEFSPQFLGCSTANKSKEKKKVRNRNEQDKKLKVPGEEKDNQGKWENTDKDE
jgi:hypothetical protein